MPMMSRSPDPFPPIGDYAVIGDCRTAALISRGGAVEWFCAPDLDSPTMFAALLDRERGGAFTVAALDARRVERRYLDRSAVLETRTTTPTGCLVVTDLMPVQDDDADTKAPQPTREILRLVECVEGTVEVDVAFAPRPNYGRITPTLRRRGCLGISAEHGGTLLLLHSDIPLTLPDGASRATGRVTLKAGERRALSLTVAHHAPAVVAPLGSAADQRLALTLDWWRRWCARLSYDGRYGRAVGRSAVLVKLMSYAPTGAIVAAPTTSLPESMGARLNWDYRYCWPRDAGLILRTLADLGIAGEARSFLGWLLRATRTARSRLLPAYDLHGRPVPRERRLDHLAGYRDSAPVRLGNGAGDLIQSDGYGAVILAAFDHVERGGALGRLERRLLRNFGDHVCAVWDKPDHGRWEMRDRPRHHTLTKVMCWVALDRLMALHARHALRLDIGRIGRTRQAIATAIEDRAWSPTLRAYAGEFGGDWPDAGLLLLPRLGYIAPDHPRMKATLRAVEHALDDNGLLRRLTDNGGEPEGAYVACGFWRVDCLARMGEVDRARTLFERLLQTVNDVGLLAEEVDPASGALLGNFPQTMSHVSLLAAAQALHAAEALRHPDRTAA